MMERRDALILLSGTLGALTQTIAGSSFAGSAFTKPRPLSFALDQFLEIRVNYKGESVTIDPAELFAALKGKP